MATYSWTGNNGYWSAPANWSPSGAPNAATADAVIAAAGSYTVTILPNQSFLVDSLTFDPAGGTLAMEGTLTLGGTLAEMSVSSGTVDISGTLAGGTLTLTGGLLDATGNGVISSATTLDGLVMIASGKTLSLSGPTSFGNDTQIDGPGALLTTNAVAISSAPYLDGSLVWDNTGTVSAGAEIYSGYPSETGTVTIDNMAGGNFDLTADGEAFYAYAGLALINAGTLAKTGGTNTSNIANAVTNTTGTITATTGVLELDGGGTLGGAVTETTSGAVTLGEGLFALTGTVNGAGTLTIDSNATLAIGSVSETIANPLNLAGLVTIASGKTLTLSGPTTFESSARIEGPGTLLTTEAAESAQRGIRYTYPPLADERDEAARVKQAQPILVVLGNPPYNAFAGTSPIEESGLGEPYKEGLQRDWGINKFNLDELYVRFFG